MTGDEGVIRQASYLCILFCIFGVIELNRFFVVALLQSFDINYMKIFFWVQGIVYPIAIIILTFGLLRKLDGNSTAVLLNYLIVNTLLYIFSCVLIFRHKEEDQKSIT